MKRLRHLFLFLVGLLLLSGCREDSDETIALPLIGTVSEAIPAEIRAELEKHIDLYEGSNPPNIEGEYLMADFVCKYDYKEGEVNDDSYADCYIAFLNQKGNHCTYEEKQGGATTSSSNVTIVGSGNNFTAYFISTTNANDGIVSTTESTVISGQVTATGIANCKYAFVVIDKVDPDNEYMEVNGYRVFYDGDYMADRYSWYSNGLRSGVCAADEEKGLKSKIMK